MLRRTVAVHGWRRLGVIASLFCAAFLADLRHGASARPADASAERAQVAERYILPITPPLDQGDSDLCYAYAALSMLETNYKVRHPGSHIQLSRGAMQRAAIADRFKRRLRGERVRLEEGGLAVEALALVRKHGLIARGDFRHAAASDPVYSAIAKKLVRAAGPLAKRKALDDALDARLGAEPLTTHLDGQALTPAQLAEAVLAHDRWIEFDRSRDGFEGSGPSRDPDARPDTRVMYAPLDRMIGLVHRSLAGGRAVVAGTTDHAFLVYGADYDRNGRPLSYRIKDSLAPFVYRESADELHASLNDVTVAF
jgi:hypothetical protein